MKDRLMAADLILLRTLLKNCWFIKVCEETFIFVNYTKTSK